MLGKFLRRETGASGVEFALIVGLITLPMMSAIDVAVYAYDRMQLEQAAQVALQAAWATCTSNSMLPVTSSTACPTASTAMTSAAQSTSLSTAVAISSTTEGYYCVDGTGALTLVGKTGTFGGAPAVQSSCPSGSTTSRPGDYVYVTVTIPFSPIFGGVSIASLFGPSISKTSWMRMNS